MRILDILARSCVPLQTFDASVRFHERVIGEPARLRFDYPERGLRLAQIGNLLLIGGEDADLEPIAATRSTFLVDDLEAFARWLPELGADVLRGPQTVPTGWNLLARHPDGTQVEYVQHREAQRTAVTASATPTPGSNSDSL